MFVPNILSSVIKLIIIFNVITSVEGAECSYLDGFEKLRLKTCYSGCCGDVHNRYCCIHKHFGGIVLGSVIGFFLLVVFLALLIYYCLARRRRLQQTDRKSLLSGSADHRDYGTTCPDSDPCAETRRPHTDIIIVPSVQIAVTPASPIVHIDELPVTEATGEIIESTTPVLVEVISEEEAPIFTEEGTEIEVVATPGLVEITETDNHVDIEVDDIITPEIIIDKDKVVVEEVTIPAVVETLETIPDEIPYSSSVTEETGLDIEVDEIIQKYIPASITEIKTTDLDIEVNETIQEEQPDSISDIQTTDLDIEVGGTIQEEDLDSNSEIQTTDLDVEVDETILHEYTESLQSDVINITITEPSADDIDPYIADRDEPNIDPIDEIMGNSNPPVVVVEEEVQPYYPGDYVEPYSVPPPAGMVVVEDVQPYDQSGTIDVTPFIERDLQPYEPEVEVEILPDVQPYVPEVEVLPDVQPYYPPEPDVQPYYPDTQPYYPDTQPYYPDTQPYDPTPAGAYNPDIGPYGDTAPYVEETVVVEESYDDDYNY